METTIALYSHDSVGLGHARRNRALAFALAEQLPERLGAPTRGILIAGSPDVAQDSLPDGWDWLILPGVTAHQTGYAPRSVRASTDEVIRMRSATIQAMLTAWLPDLFIVDRHPLGVNGELLPALRRLRSTGCATVLGLRDVLDAPAAAAREWDRLGIVDQVRRHFDAIWLYGDPAVHDQRRSGELPPALASIAEPTGYLASGRPAADNGGSGSRTDTYRPYVLTVLGGGSDGYELARHAVLAQPPAGHEHIVVTGPQMPGEQARQLRATAGPGVRILGSAPDVPELIASAAAVVSMCGYNTACEVLASSTPALMVPRVRRRQEQRVRAEALAGAGAIETTPADTLDPRTISEWWHSAVGRPLDRSRIARDGLRHAAHLAADLLDAAYANQGASRAV